MYWNTVTSQLRKILEALMKEPLFDSFRLVGGTALSLQMGHRTSVDIDLFTDVEYGTIDFGAIDVYLRSHFGFVECSNIGPIGMGITYYVGHFKNGQVKLDLFYTETFIRDVVTKDGIRMASIEDIIGMKVNVIGRGGRKKDFWDLHELHKDFAVDDMLSLYEAKYPFGFAPADLTAGFENFALADGEPDPICLLEKHWELIKLDFVMWVRSSDEV